MLMLGADAAVAQEPAPPPLWSGTSGLAPTLVSKKVGVVQPGETYEKAIKKPTRTARLTAEHSFSYGPETFTIPAGTPFYGAQFLAIPRVGSGPAPVRRKDDIHWCSAAKEKPVVCFRWTAGKVERASAGGFMILSRSPSGQWIEDRPPALKEQVVEIDPPYEQSQTLKAVTEEGVVVATLIKQGSGDWGYDTPVKWGVKAALVSGGYVVFEPVRDAAGALTAARVTPAKP
ncbi:hypothetical protein CFHF_10320 [Caulobacter flavus]|uniref:Uncharacterized protein n=2 Tax=Caulobacter flavus TaxID=1679497 RepID=A0A2N5CUD7_9CAUL|nr:hypothetical protein C1707_17265 [Caulobacter flavus]PLR16875.1 hypothetical protein CFHF_10320 [Caulobacter flavus]